MLNNFRIHRNYNYFLLLRVLLKGTIAMQIFPVSRYGYTAHTFYSIPKSQCMRVDLLTKQVHLI